MAALFGRQDSLQEVRAVPMAVSVAWLRLARSESIQAGLLYFDGRGLHGVVQHIGETWFGALHPVGSGADAGRGATVVQLLPIQIGFDRTIRTAHVVDRRREDVGQARA